MYASTERYMHFAGNQKYACTQAQRHTCISQGNQKYACTQARRDTCISQEIRNMHVRNRKDIHAFRRKSEFCMYASVKPYTLTAGKRQLTCMRVRNHTRQPQENSKQRVCECKAGISMHHFTSETSNLIRDSRKKLLCR